MMYITTALAPKKYLIVSVEITTNQPAVIEFFGGYDLMGANIDWVEDKADAYEMDPDEAEAVLKDLEAAEA